MQQSRFVILMASVAALGGLLFGYDTGVISGAIIFIQRRFALDTATQEFVVSVVLFGAMFGAFIAGGAADFLGRRLTLIGAGTVFGLGALLSAFAPNVAVLVTGRIIVGVAIGVSSVTAPLYISEVAPTATRGSLVSLYQWAITIGILAADVVDYVLSGSGAWNWMLGIAIVPSLLLALGMIRMPESPRWLFAHDRAAIGRAVLARTRPPGDVDRAIGEIERNLETHTGSWRDLIRPDVLPAVGIGIGLAVLQQVTGINTVIYYGPQIFKLAGFSSDATSILATMGVGAVNVLATVIAIVLIDRLGRKPLLYAGCAGMCIALCALAFGFAHRGPATGPIALASLMIYVGCFAFSLGPIVWLLISEMYPLRVRGRGMAIATLANWGANFVVSLVFLSMIKALGSAATFATYAALCAVTIVFVRFAIVETRNVELETVSMRRTAA